jgi:hypothetical protein
MGCSPDSKPRVTASTAREACAIVEASKAGVSVATVVKQRPAPLPPPHGYTQLGAKYMPGGMLAASSRRVSAADASLGTILGSTATYGVVGTWYGVPVGMAGTVVGIMVGTIWLSPIGDCSGCAASIPYVFHASAFVVTSTLNNLVAAEIK